MNRMMLWLLGIVIFTSGWAFAQEGGRLTLVPDQLIAQISARGAKSVLNELYKDESGWNQLINHISDGSEEWLLVAVTLWPGSDAGPASELHDAVGGALTNNPENVFRIATPAFSLSDICGGRSDPLATYELSVQELDRMIRKVKAINKPALTGSRDACMAELEASRGHLKRFFGADK